MMRTIKFRGKRNDGAGWAYGEYTTIMYRVPTITISGDKGKFEYVAVDPETIGQYTGLKDKNGKEIFEGDMLGCDEFIDVVKWEHASWRIDPCDDFLNESHRDSEVVGNIHEGEWIICDEVGYRNIHDKEATK